jgi:phosphatidylinositol dimannoside acyltransferase
MWLLRSLRVAAILTPFVPASIGYLLCYIAGIAFFLLNRKARSNVLANLTQVEPSSGLIRRWITALRVCVTVVTNYYDLIRLRSIDRDTVLDHIDLRGIEHVEQARENGRGAIIVSGHIGNFSVMARLPAALGIHAALIAERVEPSPLYNYMTRLRSAMGIDVIPPGPGSIRQTINLLKHNGVLLLAADRDVTNQGRTVTLFGRETSLPPGPVILAMKTGAPLIPAFTVRTGTGQSLVSIGPQMRLRCSGNWTSDVEANMQMLATHLEQMIRRDPGQWAVLQRVWDPTSVYGRSEGFGSVDEMAAEPAESRQYSQSRRSA